jgi:hypothetical protein
MQKITLRLLTAVLTFVIGLIATTLWWGQRTTTVDRLEIQTWSRCQWPTTNRADDIYFPKGTFLPDKVRESGLVKSYSRVLAAMHEPSLPSMVSSEVETYRFTWLRAFHPPVVVRVWKSGSERCLSIKKLDGTGEYGDGETVYPKGFQFNATRPLREVEWDTFKEQLNLGHFWSMPTVDDGPMAFDGAFWVMEGVKDDKYHVVDRQSPDSGPYREMCHSLLRLSGLHIEHGELY